MGADRAITMRRLDPDKDIDLVAEALGWLSDFPKFMQDADKAWGRASVDEYLKMMKEDPQADFGVFENGKLVAEICIALIRPNEYNSHLMMKRGANIDAVIIAAASVIKGLKEKGMVAGYSWVLKQNRGLQRILELIGMRRDGLRQIKGQSHNQPLEWLRYAI